jgi:hypothetical protein
MRPDEPRTFDEERVLDACNDEQVRAWAEDLGVEADAVREACAQVGPNRTAVELKLAAPRP